MQTVQSPPLPIKGDVENPYQLPDGFVKVPRSLLSRTDLTTTEAACITSLLSFDWDGTGCYPSNAELMKACKLKSEGSMTRLLSGLARKGYLLIDLVGRSRANPTGRVIHLTIPAPSRVSTPPTPRRRVVDRCIPGAGAPLTPAPARGELDALEEDSRTLNVANETVRLSPGEGDGGTQAADPVVSTLDPEPEPEPVPAVEAGWREGKAWFDRMRGLGYTLVLVAGTADQVTTEAYGAFQRDVSPELRDQVKASKPAILAYLRAPTAGPDGMPTATIPAAGQSRTGHAPAVSQPARAGVRDGINRLPGNPDQASEAVARRAICDALNDHKPATIEFLSGLCGQVRRGEKPAACLVEAFEGACRGSARNRGAVFVAEVRRWVRLAYRRSLPPLALAAKGGTHARL